MRAVAACLEGKEQGPMEFDLDPERMGGEAERLNADLRKRVIGQSEAISEIVSAYQMKLSGMTPDGRPIANFLFLGPTGVGKTRLVEATAESLLGYARAVIKIDCAEFQHSHEIAKLIGSPPGYLGHRETHPMLSQEVLNQYHTDKIKISFVLFDEIEKSSDALWNLMLGILDKATLTLGDNRRVDFSRAMIFMTSNLGARKMSEIVSKGMGFHAGGESAENQAGKMTRAGVEAARRKFTPEFMNRIDKTVVFKPLTEDHLRQILRIELSAVQGRVLISESNIPFVFDVTESAKEFLLREGVSDKYGAREIKRVIAQRITYPLSNLIASNQIHGGDLILIDFDGERMRFKKIDKGMSARKMSEHLDTQYPLAAGSSGAR